MDLGWKILVPLSLVWIVAVTLLRALRTENVFTTQQLLVGGGIVLIVLLAASFLIPEKQQPEPEDEAPLSGGGYPVPPMDLEVPKTPPRRTPVSSGAQTAPGEDGDDSAKETSHGNV